jgi:hypothetical protein
MKARFSPLPVVLAITLLGCARQTVNVAAERAAVLKTIAAEHTDLLAADTAALRAEIPDGDTVYNVGNGQLVRTTHGNALEGYNFAMVRYTAATALDFPVVRFSPDGRMAWVAARYRYTYMSRNVAGVEHEGELINAWLAVYEKQGSRWIGTALAQTFPPTTR